MEEPVFWFEEIAEDVDSDDENASTLLAVSRKYGTVIEADWGENGYDWVVSVEHPETDVFEIQDGYQTIAGLDVTKLGGCSKLLTESKPITKTVSD